MHINRQGLGVVDEGKHSIYHLDRTEPYREVVTEVVDLFLVPDVLPSLVGLWRDIPFTIMSK